MQGVQVRSLVREPIFHLHPDPQKKKKTQNIRSNIVTNSINTLRNVQVKKKKNEKGVEKDRGEKESPEACLSTWL